MSTMFYSLTAIIRGSIPDDSDIYQRLSYESLISGIANEENA